MTPDSAASTAQEPEILRPGSTAPVIILCDHASNHIPTDLKGLGLDPKYLDDHIAYDIGAAAMTRYLSEAFDATAVLATASRLVLDLNRHPELQEPVPAISDGIVIPGNQDLSPSQHQARIHRFHHPFHTAAEQIVTARLEQGQMPVVFSVHSFTPEMAGIQRPWHAGFLYDQDPRLAHGMLQHLSSFDDLVLGDNEPYSGQDLYYTMHRHGQAHGLAQATIEVRQDLVADREGQERWAGLIADALKAKLKEGGLHRMVPRD